MSHGATSSFTFLLRACLPCAAARRNGTQLRETIRKGIAGLPLLYLWVNVGL